LEEGYEVFERSRQRPSVRSAASSIRVILLFYQPGERPTFPKFKRRLALSPC
jgi:hypothetical protein